MRHEVFPIGDLLGVWQRAPDEVLQGRRLGRRIGDVLALLELDVHGVLGTARGEGLEEVGHGVDGCRTLDVSLVNNDQILSNWRKRRQTLNAFRRDSSLLTSALTTSTPRA